MTCIEAGEVLAVLVEAIVEADRELAVVAARRAVLVDRARQWSRGAAEAVARGEGRERAAPVDHELAERSLVAEIACALRLPEASASALTSDSQALVHEHPATMARLSAGAISYRHAQTVVDATVGLEPPAVREMDTVLSERATTATVAALKRVARTERNRRDTRPLLARHQVAAADRRVQLQPCDDGMAWLHQYLPAVQATAIFHRLTDIAVAVQGPDEPRTLAQLRADASVDLLLDDDARTVLARATYAPQSPGSTPSEKSESTGNGAAATASGDNTVTASGADAGAKAGTGADNGAITVSGTSTSTSTSTATGTDADGDVDRRSVGPAVTTGIAAHQPASGPGQSIAGIADRVSLGGIKPQVAVTIPVMTLLGHSEEPGDLAGHGPIDANTARRLAAQAPSFLRILTHPETGTVLSVGRDRYAVPADLKTWLRIRDETCRFPGCSRRAQRCDIDHVKDWAHGGTTDHHNLIHLCRHHHRLKHTTGWTVHTEPPDRPETGQPESSAPASSPALSGARHSSPQGSSSAGSSPPPGDAPLRDRRHNASGPCADAVRWTAPTGRTYLDHAALPIVARAAPRGAQLGREKPSPVDRAETGTSFADEPPF